MMLPENLTDSLKRLHPEVFVELEKIIDLSMQVTDPELLALCISNIRAALLCKDWDVPAGGLSDKEKAFIAFSEQFAMSVSTITSDQVKRLLDFATPDEVYAFVHALYVNDMRLRLEIVAAEVLP
jgi:hypothetical protein